MASYGPGHVPAGTYGPNDTFADGSIIEGPSTFKQPCTFGDAVVIGPGSAILFEDPRKPPHEAGDAFVVGEGSSVEYINIGEAASAHNPAVWAPLAIGPDATVGEANNLVLGEAVESRATICEGQEIITGETTTIEKPYDVCAKPCGSGIVRDDTGVTVVDPSRCIEGT